MKKSPISKAQGRGSPKSKSKETHLVRSTIMGERGQVVIPKDIREQAGLKAGSRLMVMHHQARGPVILLPMEHMQDFMEQMMKQMKQALK